MVARYTARKGRRSSAKERRETTAYRKKIKEWDKRFRERLKPLPIEVPRDVPRTKNAKNASSPNKYRVDLETVTQKIKLSLGNVQVSFV